MAYDTNIHAGTHGSATLDYLMHTRDPSIRKVSAGVIRGFNSDHNAVVAKYRVGLPKP